MSAEPSAASLEYAPASSGIETRCLPAVTENWSSRTTRPLMSGDHGGIPPSVAAHAERP